MKESIHVVVVSSAATYRRGGPDLPECPSEIFQRAAKCRLLNDYERGSGYYNKNIRLWDKAGKNLGVFSLAGLRVLFGGYVVQESAPADLMINLKTREANYPVHFSI